MRRYLSSRCRKNGRLYGKIHEYEYGNFTACGMYMTSNWWISLNVKETAPTCKNCLKKLNKESAKCTQ